MRKLTTEQFIEKAQQIHGSKYDYSLEIKGIIDLDSEKVNLLKSIIVQKKKQKENFV